MPSPRTCRHIKVTGVRCGSPALRGEPYCYFHYRMLCESRLNHVALLENEEAIQVSIMEVVNSLLRGTIELKRGELVLRALNTAVRNVRRACFENARGMVRDLPKDPLKDAPRDPVVQPRPQPLPGEETAVHKKQLLAEYYGTDVPSTPAAVTAKKPPLGVKDAPPPQQRKNAAHKVRGG